MHSEEIPVRITQTGPTMEVAAYGPAPSAVALRQAVCEGVAWVECSLTKRYSLDCTGQADAGPMWAARSSLIAAAPTEGEFE
jgi:hypothetical protein